MSLTKSGSAPGPVRFFLACDHLDCRERISFDLVIPEPPPDIDEDFFGHLLHESNAASGHIKDLGWTFIQGGEGYWCPSCSRPASRRPPTGQP